MNVLKVAAATAIAMVLAAVAATAVVVVQAFELQLSSELSPNEMRDEEEKNHHMNKTKHDGR